MKFEFEYLSGVFPAYPDDDDEVLQDLRVWGYGEPNHDHIRGLHGSLYHILDTLDRHGPFSGIVGFSSGAAMAAIITSLLEKRKNVCGIKWKVVQKLLILTQHPPLKFSICLSGFKLGNRCYEAFYHPRLETPMFHAIGHLDATVVPAQTMSLVRKCLYPWIYEFFGGHYVPQCKEFMELRDSLANYLREALGLSAYGQDSWVNI
ncbi:Dihydrofolate reductase [Penicillium rolfsii]|nr:Dihydrofolate reductase [Penicillium rolfsii]